MKTSNPNLEWVKQQIRNATPYDYKPKYLLHDNDSVFVSSGFKNFLTALGINQKAYPYILPGRMV